MDDTMKLQDAIHKAKERSRLLNVKMHVVEKTPGNYDWTDGGYSSMESMRDKGYTVVRTFYGKEYKQLTFAETMCEANRIAKERKTETMKAPKKRRFPEGTLQAYHETYDFLARRGWTKADRFGRETWNKRHGELTYVLPMDQAVEWEVANARDAAKTRREGQFHADTHVPEPMGWAQNGGTRKDGKV